MSSTTNRYCLAFANMPLMSPQPIEGIPFDYPPEAFNFSSPVFNYLKPYIHFFRYLNVTTGICVPRECSKKDLNLLANGLSDYYSTGLVIDVDMCQTREPHNPITWPQTIAATFVGSIVAANLLGLWAPEGSFLSQFNFSANLVKLFSTRPRSPGPTTIPCLDGLKALTMAFMLYIHVFFTLLYQNMTTFFHTRDQMTQPLFSSTLLGPFTMETFFLLTGLETTIHFIHNKTRLDGKTFLFLRWMRFVPLIAWMICLSILVFSHHFRDYMGGPYWNYYYAAGSIASVCEKTWLGHLFMVAHYFDVKEDINLCLTADWYLEADYMFAVIFVILILPFIQRKRKLIALINTTLLVLFGAIILGVIMSIFDLQHSWIPMAYPQQKLMTYLVYIHSKGWGHMSSYFIGVILGLIMGGYQLKVSKLISYFMWTLWFASWAIIVVYESAINYRLFPIPYGVSLTYGMFSKAIWSYIIAWLIYASHNGHTIELIPRFLSSKVFTILSRINLSALFVNPIVFQLRNATWHTNIETNLIDFTYNVVFPLLFLIYALSFFFCALVEVPFVNIMKSALMKEKGPKMSPPVKNDVPLVEGVMIDRESTA
ncbi:uncharacterized protein LOC128392920 isoform X2 [Panonychus citri]|nr:uncharacterized protein LOC128392920 isoform X2 [Panonychus citri]